MATFIGLLTVTISGAILILHDFTIDNSVGIWFPQDDPELVRYEQFLKDFGHTEWTLLMVETRSLEAPAFLRDLRALTTQLEAMDHIARVISLANLPGADHTKSRTHHRPGDLLRSLEQHPLASGFLLRQGDRRHTTLLLQTDNFIRRQDPYRMVLIDKIHAAVRGYPSIVDHSIAGTSVINAELNRSAKRDMFVFFSLVTVLIFLVSLALFRSLRDAATLLAVAVSTVVFPMGLIVLFGYSLNMVTIMLPTVLIALSVADVIHVVHTFHRRRRTEGAERAVYGTIRRVWLPCVGTSVTTIVGFLSLSGSSVLPVFQLAVFGALGIAMACLLSLTVAPLMLYHFWRDDRAGASRFSAQRPRYLEPLARWLRCRPSTIVLGFLAAGGGLAGLWLLDADTNYAEFFRSGARVPIDYNKIDDAGFPQNPLVVTLEAPPNAPGLAPAFWAAVRTLEDRLRALPEVKYVMSPSITKEGLVSKDGRQCQLVLMTDFMSSDRLHQFVERVHRLKRETIPEIAIATVGTTVLWASMDTQVIKTQVSSAFIVSVAILVVLTLVFRSLPLALVGWLVSVFPVALILGLMGFFGVRINMATVLIAGISLGIAVDDTIHFVFAYRSQLRKDSEPCAATERALFEIGPRMILTTVVLIGGFGSLALSDFLPTAYFGAFACLTIFVALLTDLTLLPILLRFTTQASLTRGSQVKQLEPGNRSIHRPIGLVHQAPGSERSL